MFPVLWHKVRYLYEEDRIFWPYWLLFPYCFNIQKCSSLYQWYWPQWPGTWLAQSDWKFLIWSFDWNAPMLLYLIPRISFCRLVTMRFVFINWGSRCLSNGFHLFFFRIIVTITIFWVTINLFVIRVDLWHFESKRNTEISYSIVCEPSSFSNQRIWLFIIWAAWHFTDLFHFLLSLLLSVCSMLSVWEV